MTDGEGDFSTDCFVSEKEWKPFLIIDLGAITTIWGVKFATRMDYYFQGHYLNVTVYFLVEYFLSAI